MNFTIEISEKTDEDKWIKNLQQNKSSTIYHHPNFSRSYQHIYKSKMIFLHVYDPNDNIVAQQLLHIFPEYPWHYPSPSIKYISSKLKLGVTLSWFYGPIIFDKQNENKILELILKTINDISKEKNVSLITGSTTPLNHISKTPFLSNDYSVIDWKTYLIDLSNPIDYLWNNISKEARNDVTRARKKDVTIHEVKSQSELEDYVSLLEKHISNLGIKNKNVRDTIYEEWKYLIYKNNLGKIFLAYAKDKAISGLTLLTFNGNIIQQGLTSLKDYRSFLGGPLLTWHVIEWGNNMHYTTFDLAGANPQSNNKKEKSIDFYKSKWGGRELEHYRCVKIYNKKKSTLFSLLKCIDKTFNHKLN